MTQGDLESMFRSLKKAVIERAMGAEISDHLGYRQGEDKPEGQTNQRNGTSGKTVITDDGPLRIEVPRDREGSFEPQIIGKHERRFTGFDQKIIAMYARGMTVREIQGYLAEMYGTEVSPGLHQQGHGRGDRRDHGLAEPAAGADVPGGVLRCPAREDPR
jgi:transposase-like protein